MNETLTFKTTAIPMHGNFRIHPVDGNSGPERSKGPRRIVQDADLGPVAKRAPRVVLYSHDTMGIGHVRRNLLLAQAINQAYPEASILLIAGAREASRFDVPSGIDFVTLPALSKSSDGVYGARDLKLPLSELISIRRQTLEAAIWGFQPDLLIVDKVPRGAEGELTAIVQRLSAAGNTKIVLGLRDILDAPDAVAADWERDHAFEFIIERYDEVWIYGDRNICDPICEYSLPPAIAAKTRFVGYLDQASRLLTASDEARCQIRNVLSRPERLALCLLGGGQDGEKLARCFSEARLPEGMYGVLVTGPFMPPALRKRLADVVAKRSQMEVLDFVPEADFLVQHSERVIAMGGYNTVSSILSFNKPALIVPRIFPRIEQQIRAQRLEKLDLLDVIHPDSLSSEGLSAWLHAPLKVRPQAASVVDMAGLKRIPEFVRNILSPSPTSVAADTLPRVSAHHPEILS
jgi:predicted glycosyltransferase